MADKVKKKLKSKKSEDTEKDLKKEKMSSVVKLKYIPHGFYEKQIFQFFSQFGTVRKVKVLRNRKVHFS